MSRFYVPYSGDAPVSIEVNGHRLILLAQDPHVLEDDLENFGADSIRSIKVDDGEIAQQKFFQSFAVKNGAGIVVLPMQINLDEFMENLLFQLPWIH